MSTALVWFRRDLRLHDNPALIAALETHENIVPVYIHAPHEEAPWQPGAASNVWLHHSLTDLQSSLKKLTCPLVIRNTNGKESSLSALNKLLEDTGADTVYWNRLYEPAIIERDKAIKADLTENGFTATSCKAALLVEPWEVQTGGGAPYRVFTPFWKNIKQRPVPQPLAKPEQLASIENITSETLDSLSLLPTRNWGESMISHWQPGEAGAVARLEQFLGAPLKTYADDRNRPDREGSSNLSPHLHFGEISPRQIWHATEAYVARSQAQGGNADGDKFLSEIAWREFAHHLLFYYPETTEKPMNAKFSGFPWRDSTTADYKKELQLWQKGNTGIPIIDAGLRELYATGVMHNRVRMIAASLLTKNMLIHWHDGAAWFWDTLVDADLAANSLGWQWVAGSGADAAPYFRIFNPVLQGEKFDPEGDYVRHWVPEVAKLPKKWVHKPWEAKDEVLQQAGFTLGKHYPRPIVDLKVTRQRALDAYKEIKG